MIKDQLVNGLKNAVKEVTGLEVTPVLEVPQDPGHGDYASNIAMAIFSSLKFKVQSSKFKTPLELAQEIVKILNTKYLIHNTDRVEAVTPGFINFWLSRQYLLEHLREIVGKNSLLASQGEALQGGQGKKVMVEFADPNPFKEFHIGHLRNISLGESLSRLLEAQGAKVFRANYQGDVGMHVAKALYGIQNSKVKIQNKKDLSLAEKVKILGEAYALGSRAYEEDEAAKKEIQELNIKVYKNDSKIREIWEMGRKWSLDAFEEVYKRLGTKYDYYYFESQTAPIGRQIVLDHLQKGVFERHDGAVVFRGEKHGLHTRVFVTKEDYATYEAKDLALAQLKYKDVPYDRSIILTAHEQAPYFSVILTALKLIAPDLAAKTIHYSFGFVSLKEGKMSSRSGNVITAKFLLDEAKTRIKAQFKEILEETAEKVAVGAVKYSMLKFSPSSDIAFSFEESISLEGNSGPYLQYSFARTQSVLRKAKKDVILRAKPEGSEILPLRYAQGQNDNRRGQNDISSEELSILRLIHRFPEVVEEAAEGFAPNLICNYLFELAQAFNLFYQKHPILPRSFVANAPQDDSTSQFRLALTASVGQILKSGLYLLGIEAPQRM